MQLQFDHHQIITLYIWLYHWLRKFSHDGDAGDSILEKRKKKKKNRIITLTEEEALKKGGFHDLYITRHATHTRCITHVIL